MKYKLKLTALSIAMIISNISIPAYANEINNTLDNKENFEEVTEDNNKESEKTDEINNIENENKDNITETIEDESKEDTTNNKEVIENETTITNDMEQNIMEDIIAKKENTNIENIKNQEKIVYTDSFEETKTTTNGNSIKYWKDAIVPTNWDNIWVATAPSSPEKLQFAIDTNDKVDGNNSIHIHSEGSEGRIAISSLISNIDYNNDYILKFDAKTENVSNATGKLGFYVRAQVGEKGNKFVAMTNSIKGTNNWTTYELSLRKLAQIAGDNSNKMKIEIFSEFMSGDVWIDNIRLIEDYRLNINYTQKDLDIGETLKLSVTATDETIDLSNLQWTSSNPDVAIVDNTGNVIAKKLGVTDIVAKLDDNHFVTCKISVRNVEAENRYFEIMREKWVERLTGNSYWKGEQTSLEYKNIISKLDADIDEILTVLVDNNKLFTDLENLKQPDNPKTTDPNHSKDFRTAINRIQTLATGYMSEGSKYYKDEELKEKIITSLNLYHDNYYGEQTDNKKTFGNWWDWWIGIPQSLASTIILMYDEIPQDLLEKEANVLQKFNEDPIYVYKVQGANSGKMDMTGANLADTSLASILRGAACNDPIAAANGTKYFDNIVKVVTSGEGIYKDGSFIQHKNLAYTGGYGTTLLTGAGKLIYMSTDTGWELSNDQLQNLYNWIWDGVRPLYAKGAMFDMVSGRGIARPSHSDYATGTGLLREVILLSGNTPINMKNDIQSFIKGQLLNGIEVMGRDKYLNSINNPTAIMEAISILEDETIIPIQNDDYSKIFGGMDKAVAHTKDFNFGVSMASKRTGRTEYGNHENKKGWNQSNGATYIYNGDSKQYGDNYWNTVDSDRLAGTTTDGSRWELKDWQDYTGASNYVGGATLEQYMALGMQFKNYDTSTNPDLSAKKSWFVFDDEIVALGSDIKGIKSYNKTETIVDNKKIKDNATNKIFVNGEQYEINIDTQNIEKNVNSIWLEGNINKDNIGYYFPTSPNVSIKKEARTGSWKDINGGVKEENFITKNYVSFALEHKEKENNEYSYVILPSKTKEELDNYVNNSDIEILANTKEVQAVKHQNIQSFIFWENDNPVRIENVEATNSSVIIKDDKENNLLHISIASPTQTENNTKVRIYGEELKLVNSDDTISVDIDNSGANITVNTTNDLGTSHNLTLQYKPEENNNGGEDNGNGGDNENNNGNNNSNIGSSSSGGGGYVISNNNNQNNSNKDNTQDNNQNIIVLGENKTIATTTTDKDGKQVNVNIEKSSDTIKVNLTKEGKSVNKIDNLIKLQIPTTVNKISIVPILVDENGNEIIIKNSYLQNGNMILKLNQSGTIKFEDRSKSFIDIDDNDWFKNSVDFVTSRNLLVGMKENEFGANENISRAMLTTVLYRFANEPEISANSSFTDIKPESYYYKAVAWAYQNNFVSGISSTNFSPNNPISREQLVTILYRFVGSPTVTGEITNIDKNNISTWANDAMLWAVENGIILGRTNGNLDPKDNITRAETSEIIKRLIMKQ